MPEMSHGICLKVMIFTRRLIIYGAHLIPLLITSTKLDMIISIPTMLMNFLTMIEVVGRIWGKYHTTKGFKNSTTAIWKCIKSSTKYDKAYKKYQNKNAKKSQNK